MAEKLSIEIALEGGDEIARQLGDIGKIGAKAFQDIGRAAEKVGGFDQLDPTDVTAKLVKMGITGSDAINKIQTAVKQAGRLEQVVAGVQQLENGFDKLGISVDKFANRMAGSLGPLGVFARALGPLGVALGVGAAAFIKFGNDAAKALGELNTQGAKLGLTAQQFDGFQQAMGKLGISSEALTSDMKKLNEVFAQTSLVRLGDNFNIPPEATAAFERFIGVLERMPDSVARTQLAVQTLGETLGGQVIAGLQTGTLSAANFAQALGSVTPATQEQIRQAAVYSQALVQLGSAWEQFKTALTGPVATPAIEWLTSQLPGIAAGIQTTVREFQALWDVINQIGTAGAQIIGGLVEMVNTLGRAALWAYEQFLKLVGLSSKATPGVSTATPGTPPGMAGGGLLGGSGTGTSDSNLAWVSRGEHIMPASVVRRPGVLSLLEVLRRGGGIPGFAAGGAVGGLAPIFDKTIDLLKGAVDALRQLQQGFNTSMTNVVQSVDSLAEPFNSSMNNIVQMIVASADTLQQLNQATNRASGGLLGGRGTGTSDSNLAWVSRGEYITPASAVRQPGVFEFLELLRRSGGDLSRVLNGMGHFALGGMIPRYAAGGLAGGGSNVTIQFPGLPPISGLRASSNVVEQLQKAAALAQVRSGGRKPSRYS